MKDSISGNTEAILSDRSVEISPAQIEENLRLIEDLKFFLATAPANWQKNQIIRRYYLNHDEGFVSCVFWNNLYFITGTDIVRCIVYRFEQFGREITDRKKFEEGIFSDLRSLKCGSDAVLEASKSPFLDFLYKNSCLRTQKKQKVFFWFSVPHDKLFADALERDLKKEKQNQAGTTKSKTEPALSFGYDDSKPLYEQLVDHLDIKKKLYASSETSSINGGDIPSSAVHTPLISSQATELLEPEPQTFYIKEEEDELNVTKAEDDDFPLDYFPIQDSKEPMMIDPSVFMNPPESYNDEYLIDQTYAKTPFSAVRFDTPGQHPIRDDNESDDIEEQYVPVSTYMGQAPQQAPSYYVQPQQVPYNPYQMTNGQYYDSQMEGDAQEYVDVPEFDPYEQQYTQQPVYQQQIPYPYYGAGGYAPYGVAMVPQQPMGYYYEEQQQQPVMMVPNQYYPAFVDEMQEEDGDDELYVSFRSQQQQQQPKPFSPFSRGFPSFQAAAPPPQVRPLSASRLRHQIVPPRGRVTKPGKPLKHQFSQQNLHRINEELKKNQGESVGSSSKDLENTDELEYHSLPTPESTAPDPWNYHKSVRNTGSGSIGGHSSNGGENNNEEELNDYLEDKIYDEVDEDKQ